MDLSIWGYAFMQNAVLAGAFGGGACAAVGVLVVTMQLSFLGVAIAHAAFAGALLATILGLAPLIGSFVFSLAAVGIVGPLSDRGEFGPDTPIGIVFSLTLGLAFLFMGLLPGPRTEALDLLWGSILTVSRADVALLGGLALAVGLLVLLFFKEIQAVIFHRELALAVGMPAQAIYYGLLIAVGLVITASLPSIGGLLVFALILNPAAAAYQLTYRLGRMFLIAVAFGVASTWAGLLGSWLFRLPSGATIVLVSTAIFIAAAAFSPKRRRRAA